MRHLWACGVLQRSVLLVAVVFALLVDARLGHAQAGVDLRIFRPTPFAHGAIVTDRADTGEQWDYSIGLTFDYALNPLVWRNRDNTIVTAVEGQIFGELGASISFLDWLAAGVSLPVSLGFFANDLRGLSPAPNPGIGDLRVLGKVRILDQYKHFVSLAIIPEVTFPTGSGQAYLGSSTVAFVPRLVVSKRLHRVELSANVGARIRGEKPLPNIAVGSELAYAASVVVTTPWPFRATRLDVFAELWGLTAAKKPFAVEENNVLEWLLGGKLGIFDKLVATVGIGSGFIAGYGSPDFRVIAGLSWSPREPDRDFDGKVDSRDECPDEPENYNDIDDDDGCPEGDRDNDGIPDVVDRCPDQPENRNGYQDSDGCPDRKPVTKVCEDADENDEPDDNAKKEPCIERKAVPLAPKPVNLDADRDGVPIPEDKCPDEPETINGIEDEDGCPDEGEGATVFVSKQEIRILQKINFETGSAKIKPESFSILDQVAQQLRGHTEVLKMRIEGHTDSVGADLYNLRLSQARAESVMTYLVNKGVAAERLVPVGYGESKPIASNNSDFGKAQNRRVQFVILEQLGDEK